MSTELFVDGICELDDKTIQYYFARFGSHITNYESQRHRPTNSCCFAFISFVSHHTVNTILRQRPHSINSQILFVKRLLPSGVCSFIERLLPVSSIFLYNKISKEFDEAKLKDIFQTFGRILKFEHDYNHNRLFIEYDDYDSIDKIFLNKDHIPNYIDIHKNILPRAQNSIAYHGTCRRKQQQQQEISTTTEKKKKQHEKKHKHLDEQYQDLLQKTIENLGNCKAQLRDTENEYLIVQMEYATIKDKYDKLNEHLNDQNKITPSCLSCKEHQVTIIRLQEILLKLNEQYETIKSQYQRLLPTTSLKSVCDSSIQQHQYIFTTRLNNDEVSENCFSQSNLPTPVLCNIVSKQENSPSPIIRSRTSQHRITYKYDSVKNDEE